MYYLAIFLDNALMFLIMVGLWNFFQWAGVAFSLGFFFLVSMYHFAVWRYEGGRFSKPTWESFCGHLVLTAKFVGLVIFWTGFGPGVAVLTGLLATGVFVTWVYVAAFVVATLSYL